MPPHLPAFLVPFDPDLRGAPNFAQLMRPLLAGCGLLVLVGAAVFLPGRCGVPVDPSARSLLEADARNRETFEKVASILPEKQVLVLVTMKIPDLFSNPGAELLANVSEQVWSLPGCTEVKSLTHSTYPQFTNKGLVFETFIPPVANPAAWEQVRDFTTRFPMSRNVLVSEDGQWATLLAFFDLDLENREAKRAFRETFHTTLDPIRAQTDALHVLSYPFIEVEVMDILRGDLTRYLVLATCFLLLVLWVTFRHVAAVATVLLLEGGAFQILLGLFALNNVSLNLYTAMLFPLIGGIQLTFLAHYLVALRGFAETHEPGACYRLALAEVLRPSLTAAATTLVGLFALGLCNLASVRSLGWVGGQAVLALVVWSFAVPAGLAWRHRNAGAAAPEPSDADLAIPPAGHRLFGMRYIGAAGLLFLGLAMLAGLPRVRTDIRAIEFLRPNQPIRQTLERLNHDLGGVNIFQLNIDTGRPMGIQERPVLEYLEGLRSYARSLEGISDAYAYSQLFVALNQMKSGDFSREILPEDDLTLFLFRQLLNASPLLFKDAFVGPQNRSTVLILRSRDLPAKSYLSLLEQFMAFAQETRPEGLEISPVQGLHTLLESDRLIVRSQVMTLGAALAGTLLLLGMLWWNAALALRLLLANTPALLVIPGIMGWGKLPLNSVTVMAAAIVLGIVVDDGIHFVEFFRGARRRGLDRAEALQLSLAHKWRPMLCTTLILAGALGLLGLSSFPPVAAFGLICLVALLVAWCGAMTLLPWLLARSSKASASHDPGFPPQA